MRLKLIFILLLFIPAAIGFSQSNIDKIIIALNSTEVIKNCIAFKKDLNAKMAQVKSMQGLDAEKFNNLRLAYTEVYEKYDAFLKAVKLDLSSTGNLKNLVSNPDAAAQNYATAYQAVKDAYETNFMVQYNNLAYDGTKGLPFVVLLKFGFSAFKLIASAIKTKQIDKEESINLLLPLINEKLFNRLNLQTWSQLDLPEPVGYEQEEALVVPAKSINTLNGSVSFYLRGNDGLSHPVSFALNEGTKDLGVVSENGNHVSAHDEYFTTQQTYPVGTKFRMEINNAGFSYVLALNSNGIVLLYPDMPTAVKNTGDTKDLIVESDETPSTGLIRVPDHDAAGNPRFFTITRNATGAENKTEEMAVLLSKSELVLEEIIQKMNSVEGNLSERITKVFGEQKIPRETANLFVGESSIHFNADNSNNSVLPLVFKILKP